MRIFGMTKILFLILLLLITVPLYSQEKDIVPLLKLIEGGAKDSVMQLLPELKKSSPNDPSVLFLEGVLTENGQDAIPIYNRILNDFPKSKYADASVYRLYSYYYSLGLYNTAESFLKRLKQGYPSSPYIKLAEREIPSGNEVSSPQELSPDNTEDYQFTIQAGAFSNDSNAVSLKQTFENAGYYSFIKNKSVGGTEFRVVYVGRFEKREEAESFLQAINGQFDLRGQIVPIK
jgi:tetratricopeptide (TPR) repeat protein